MGRITARIQRDVAPDRTPTNRLILPAIVTLAMATSGCLFASEVDVSIAADGSGSAESLIQYDADMARVLGPATQFEEDILDAQARGADVEIVPASSLEEPFTEGLRYRADFADTTELRDVMLDGPFDTATVRLEDGLLTIDARFEGTGTGGDDDFMSGMMPSAAATVRVDVEGTVIESDADRTSGSTLIWEYDITEDGRLQLTAELGGGFPTGLLLGGLGAVVAGGVGLGVAAKRRRTTRGSGQSETQQSGSTLDGPGTPPNNDDW